MQTNRIVDFNMCMGCGACVGVCGKKSIAVKLSDGFWRAEVDGSLCINCGRCKDVCPQFPDESNVGNKNFTQRYFAARHRDPQVVRSSSSGGVFFSCARAIIQDGGVVYGVIIEYPGAKIQYARAETLEDCKGMQGSKYVEALMPESLIGQLLEDARSDREVLFTGTSCVIAGIRKLLKIHKITDYRFRFMDFYCAGVISPELWDAEVGSIEKKIGEIGYVTFRGKDFGWRDFCMKYRASERQYRERFVLSTVGLMQARPEALGEACGQCLYRSWSRPSDLTIGDFWNEYWLPQRWKDDKGTSAVLVNTEKGEMLLNRAERAGLVCCEVKKEACNSDRIASKKGNAQKPERIAFWGDFRSMGYEEFKKKWFRVSPKDYFLLGIVRPILIKLGLLRWKRA